MKEKNKDSLIFALTLVLTVSICLNTIFLMMSPTLVSRITDVHDFLWGFAGAVSSRDEKILAKLEELEAKIEDLEKYSTLHVFGVKLQAWHCPSKCDNYTEIVAYVFVVAEDRLRWERSLCPTLHADTVKRWSVEWAEENLKRNGVLIVDDSPDNTREGWTVYNNTQYCAIAYR